MPNVSNFGTSTDNAVVQGTVTDRQMVIPDVPPQGLMSVGPRVSFNFIKEPWSEQTSYAFYDVVKDANGNSYVAMKPTVPAGTALSDGNYWFKWSEPNAQIENLYRIVEAYDEKIKTASTYNSNQFTGLVNDGITDNANIFNNLSKNAGLREGIYAIKSNCSINAAITFAKGSILKIDDNVTVTINGDINAGFYKIFDGNGTLKINGKIKPEWFGAKNDLKTECSFAFNKMFESIDNAAIIELQPSENNTNIIQTPKGYKISEPIKINHSRIYINGNYATFVSGANTAFIINDKNEYQEEVTIENIYIYSNATQILTGIDASNTTRCHIKNVHIFNCTTGIKAENTTNLILNGVYVYIDSTENIANEYIGFKFNGINASLRIIESHATDLTANEIKDKLIGISFDGNSSKDFIISKCEFNNAKIGMLFGNDDVEKHDNFDCFISDTIFDINTECVKINNLGSSSKITFSNCWFLTSKTSTTAIECNTSSGIVIKGCQFTALNSKDKYAFGIIINNSNGISIIANTFTNIKNAINIGSNGNNGICISNNIFATNQQVSGGMQPTQYEYAISGIANGLVIIGNVSAGNVKYTTGINTPNATNENTIIIGNAINASSNNLGNANNEYNITL